MKRILAVILTVGLILGLSAATALAEEPAQSYNVSGVIQAAENGMVSGTLTDSADPPAITLTVSGTITDFEDHTATLTGTVSGGIEGEIEATVNDAGVAALSGEITGADDVRWWISGYFPKSVADGKFVGKVSAAPPETYVTGITVDTETGDDNVEVGKTLQMVARVEPGGASDKMAWSVKTDVSAVVYPFYEFTLPPSATVRYPNTQVLVGQFGVNDLLLLEGETLSIELIPGAMRARGTGNVLPYSVTFNPPATVDAANIGEAYDVVVTIDAAAFAATRRPFHDADLVFRVRSLLTGDIVWQGTTTVTARKTPPNQDGGGGGVDDDDDDGGGIVPPDTGDDTLPVTVLAALLLILLLLLWRRRRREEEQSG